MAVAALSDDRHNGRLYELTGPRLPGFADVAKAITEGAGHSVTYVPLDADTLVALY